MPTPDLMERIEQKIKSKNFNIFEMTGFKTDPYLALIAGAAIGYKLGVDDYQKIIEKIYAENK